jgi:transposase
MAEKRRIVELVLQPGVSVARVAQAEGVNANQVFKWRREYRNSRLVEGEKSTTSLLPVVVSATSFEAGIALSAPGCPDQRRRPVRSTLSFRVEQRSASSTMQMVLCCGAILEGLRQ